MATKHQKIKIEIPKGFDPSTRREIAEDIAEFIRDRTESGYGFKNGRKFKFPAYSKEYVKSLDFKIAGKTKANVDLTLSGDMLASLDLLDHGDGYVVIGFEKGSDENAKADGNIRGTYGRPSPDEKKARPFLGLSNRDLDKILSRHKDKQKHERAKSQASRETVS